MTKQKPKQKRPGRPAGRNYEVLQISIEPQLKADLIEYSENTGGTVSASLRPLLRRGLEEMKREQFQQSDLHKYTGDTIMVKEASHDQED